MGDSVYFLGGQITVPVEPGLSLINGWYPCTFVKFSTTTPKYNSLGIVERSDGKGYICGFLITGPQHNNPVEKLDDMWNTDTRKREGGETRVDWTGIDAGIKRRIDSDGLLGRMGTEVVSMAVIGEGVCKTYIYEVDYLGSALDYLAGDELFISSNGLLTKVQEGLDYINTGYAVYKTGEDREGKYLIFGPIQK